MRPRQSSLGIDSFYAIKLDDFKSFNEAEAIKPRNPVPA